MCVRVLPVLFVSKVDYHSRADAGHAPLAVVPLSCDNRQLRSTQTFLTIYMERSDGVS